MEQRPLSEAERRYLIGFAHNISLGPQKLSKLWAYFGSWERAWYASQIEMLQAGFTAKAAKQQYEFRGKNDPARLIERLEEVGVEAVCLDEPDYPFLLAHIYAPPFVLFYRGDLFSLQGPTLAVVGTRKLTNYGAAVCQQIVPPLARAGITIVSGLALGTDTVAHRVALESGGRAAAVLGCGPDNIYPTSNAALGQLILERGGVILSEYPPGVPPLRQHFPARNRIISGLSLGTLIIEAGVKSGSLITASDAVEQNREVFGAPGSIFSERSRGVHELLKAGGRIVTRADDILQTLGFAEKIQPEKAYLPRNPEEATILKALSEGPLRADELIAQTGLDAQTVQQSLTLMELSGGLRHQGNGVFSRN